MISSLLRKLVATVQPLLSNDSKNSQLPESKKESITNEHDDAVKSVFTRIYAGNLWAGTESKSGPGSDLQQTEVLRAQLPLIFEKFNINTILDIPCGDFNWMRHVDLSGRKYIGGDIVEDVISNNNIRYQKENIDFIKLDLISDKLPKVDVILCRDCLVHFSFENVFSSLRNMVESGSTYLLTTTFTERSDNLDIKTGDWRVLNLEKAPFLLPSPELLINEKCTENDGIYYDKSMGLWRLDDIGMLLKG